MAATGDVPSTTVELQIEVQNLPKMDITSLSDPQVIVYSLNGGNKIELGRTEVAKDQNSFKFVKTIQLSYLFEVEQKLLFEVWDIDRSTKNDYIGDTSCTLGQIMGSTGQKLAVTLRKYPTAVIIIRGEMVTSQDALIHFTLSAESLDKKDFLGKSDPYVTIYRCNHDKTFSPVFKTEVIRQNLNPSWATFSVTSQRLCNSDDNRPIRFEVSDWDSDTSSDLIGVCEMTLQDLRELANKTASKSLELVHPKKMKKKKYTNSGVLWFKQIRFDPVYHLLDYIAGGCELQFVVAVDFTGSNGHPSNRNSLHYQGNPEGANEYVEAMASVGNIIQYYDADKIFPAYGFGAKVGGRVMDDFALNFNPGNPNCNGVNGIINAYRLSINNPTVELWGPTNFAPIIHVVARMARQVVESGRQIYYVLTILTDGVITDLDATKSAIVELSKLPVSIIIIGVGKADFTQMNALDSDDKLIRDRWGHTAERDIVQ
eukprot:Ihof_evm2s653 gene=Ihof_evmTU2s653